MCMISAVRLTFIHDLRLVSGFSDGYLAGAITALQDVMKRLSDEAQSKQQELKQARQDLESARQQLRQIHEDLGLPLV